ncbi:MAG TPA: hypothetical protein ENI85_02770 [Deltaproteobacteria bacterium]|nr:hypothetical protein [Deltaproteobacteria bacterium]
MTGMNPTQRPNALRSADPSANGAACAVRAMAVTPTTTSPTTHAHRWTFVDPIGCGTRKRSADLAIGTSIGPKTGEGDSGTGAASV